MRLRNGPGGKSFNDMVLAGKVRTLALTEMEKILKGRSSAIKTQLVLKLAGSVLPRLNEHTGQDGKDLKITFDSAFKDAISS